MHYKIDQEPYYIDIENQIDYIGLTNLHIHICKGISLSNEKFIPSGELGIKVDDWKSTDILPIIDTSKTNLTNKQYLQKLAYLDIQNFSPKTGEKYQIYDRESKYEDQNFQLLIDWVKTQSIFKKVYAITLFLSQPGNFLNPHINGSERDKIVAWLRTGNKPFFIMIKNEVNNFQKFMVSNTIIFDQGMIHGPDNMESYEYSIVVGFDKE